MIPFDPSKHPRQTHGRFGYSPTAHQQQAENKQAATLREQAHDDRQAAKKLDAQIRLLVQQRNAAGVTTGKSKAAAKGKSGTAKKMTTKKTATTTKKKSTTSRTSTSAASKVAAINSQISTLRQQVRVLNSEAAKLDARARAL